jgi:hypothetical protein
VELDRVAVALRPRNSWEALDLGFQMAREWWRPIWGVWFAVYLPIAAIALAAFDNKLHAVLLLWWLKPAFDRAVLHAASRAVFGERIGVMATLRAWKDWLWPGLIGALTLGRLDLARSFVMPVATLEKQRGSAARKRRSTLAARTRGTGVWLTVVCYHMEAVALFATLVIAGMLIPSAAELVPADPFEDPMVGLFREMFTWNLQDGLHYVLAVSLVEPFYVAAGFALYLNRRTVLEGWDIELQLRRLEHRLRATAPAVLFAIAIACGMLLDGGTAQAQAPQQAQAQAPQVTAPAQLQQPKSAQEEIRRVLEAPEFGVDREIRRWRYVGEVSESRDKDRSWSLPESLRNLILFFADISQGLLWVLAAIAAALILYALVRFLPAIEPRRARYQPPDTLFGLNVAPESLPDDVAAAALAAARAGRAREALSLLYRGALSALVHRYEAPLQAGDTEGDCVRAANARLPEPGSQYFRQLVGAWQAAAYGAKVPPPEGIEALCGSWPQHFAQVRQP